MKKIISLGLAAAVFAVGIGCMQAIWQDPTQNPGRGSPSAVQRSGTDNLAVGSTGRAASDQSDTSEQQNTASASRDMATPAEPPPGKPETITAHGTTYPVRTYRPLAMPNDPSANQWWVTQAKLDQSWDVAAGAEPTLLAVIDGGVALDHEEFSGRWHLNQGESGPAVAEEPSALNCTDLGLPLTASCNQIDDDSDGVVDNESGSTTVQNPSRRNCTALSRPLDKSCNRIDDDGNGFIDDANGWDFANGDNLPQAGEVNPAGGGTTHGTRVAGIAAASGNNGRGIAGVDWQTRLLPLQALDDESYGNTYGVGRAIEYAVEQGADVISISLGSDLPDGYVREAVLGALRQGVVVVAAAGNDGCACMVYPANYPEVLAVGALNTTGLPAAFSSYGSNLDLLAPGVNLTSPSWTSGNTTSSYSSGLSGTSFATPMVAGMITRLKSQRPNATPLQLQAALLESINRLTLPSQPVRSDTYGFGSLDTGRAAARMANPRAGEFLYVFAPISRGGYLTPATPVEPAGSTFLYACEAGEWPSTAITELTRSGASFFSASQAEVHRAVQSGYAQTHLAYGCVRQPHDPLQVMRTLNVFREFRNLDTKLY